MEETLKDILPEGNVTLVLSEDGSGKGAALVAAVASKHKPDYTQWKLCGHNVNITEKDVDWYQLNYSWWAHCKLYEKLTLSLKALFLVPNKAIFVWPLNENSRTKQKQQRNGNRAIWLVGWLSKRSGEKTQELSRNQSILRSDVILQNDWPIEQCLLHIRVFFGGKRKRPCFDLFIHWLIDLKQITNTYRNHFSRSYEKRSDNLV